MDIEKLLKDQFPVINKAFFEREIQLLFLRVEVNLVTMDEVENISRKISDFLDEKYTADGEYYLDVYSKGSEPTFEYEEIAKHLERYVEIELVDQSIPLIVKLQAADEVKLLALENHKGQMKKIIVPKEKIKSLKLHIKI
ncbi:hypothetical protein NV226_00620 [Mycoplasma iguanae]|uniref:Ribosome maturation factor RimP N-terminal domain-containing protein n=1 Tax=Mycoplasma iguanae TaxID=292461 RepID=A0ABY5R8P3_9MOLU|nr:hypothetical protein [Mycoplasma iguanae]UVD81808.1 hypothetical protein NV226_00620 [Mycoplasma iguanae]